MNVSELKKGFNELPLDDRLRLLKELWEDLAENTNALDLTPAEQAELERRFDNHRADPTAAKSWDQMKDEMRSRH